MNPSVQRHKTMAWHGDDWVAFFGGKGSYSSFDTQRHQDQFIRMNAHHEDFEYMLWKMEHGSGAKPNNNFGILEAFDDFEFRNGKHQKRENKYSKNPMRYGFWF